MARHIQHGTAEQAAGSEPPAGPAGRAGEPGPVAGSAGQPAGAAGQAATQQERSAGGKADALNLWAGRFLVGISLLHIAFFTVLTWRDWSAWATGALWGPDPAAATEYQLHMGFWALLGSFAAPMLLLGLVVIRLSRQGVALPAYLGWGLLAWVLVCAALVEPSGFPLGLIPAFLLIAAHRRPAGSALGSRP